MGIRINTNTSSLTALRNMSQAAAVEQASTEKLSSGSRVNKAADDAAALSISSKMNAQIRSQSQGIRNASDGISLLQTAEGGFNEISNILVRLRELAIQASSGTVGNNERSYIDREAEVMMSRITQVAKSTQYNGLKLLASDNDDFQIHMGLAAGGESGVYTIDRTKLYSTATRLGLGEVGFAEQSQAQDSLAAIDSAINRVSSRRAWIGALQNQIVSGRANAEVSNQNKIAANSQIKDADFAQAATENAHSKILEMAGLAVLAQANQNSSVALKLIG
jgi:flagellin